MKQLLYILILLIFASCNQIDNARFKALIEKGNEAADSSNFSLAESYFNQAKEYDKNNHISYFNLGNTHYKNNLLDSAYLEFEQASTLTNDTSSTTKIYHNFGNAYLKKYHLLNDSITTPNDSTEKLKKDVLEKALNQFKLSLNADYKNDSAQYNYIYTLNLLKQEENNPQENQDKNEDKKEDQDKDKNQQEKQDQNKDGKDKKEEQKQPSQPQNISKNQALQDLKALENKEKKLLQKLNLKKEQGTPVKTEKDW
ncbi:MAG: hypothetical protein ACLGGV_00720 [Bacteroidia bacterium]